MEKISAEAKFKAFSIQRLGNSRDPTHWAHIIIEQLTAQQAKQREVELFFNQILNSKSEEETGYIIMANAHKMDDIFFDCLDTLYISSLMKKDVKKARQYDTLRAMLPKALSALKSVKKIE